MLKYGAIGLGLVGLSALAVVLLRASPDDQAPRKPTAQASSEPGAAGAARAAAPPARHAQIPRLRMRGARPDKAGPDQSESSGPANAKDTVRLSPAARAEFTRAMKTRILQAPIGDMDLPPAVATKLREATVTYEKKADDLTQQMVDGELTVDEFEVKLNALVKAHLAETDKILGKDKAADLHHLRQQRLRKHIDTTRGWYKTDQLPTAPKR